MITCSICLVQDPLLCSKWGLTYLSLANFPCLVCCLVLNYYMVRVDAGWLVAEVRGMLALVEHPLYCLSTVYLSVYSSKRYVGDIIPMIKQHNYSMSPIGLVFGLLGLPLLRPCPLLHYWLYLSYQHQSTGLEILEYIPGGIHSPACWCPYFQGCSWWCWWRPQGMRSRTCPYTLR